MSGIAIISEMLPYNDGDFALMDDEYLRGGYRVVADTTERDAITADRRKTGMVARVLADNLEYIWNGSAWVAPGYEGENTINTVGTITAGVWQGDAIADDYIDSAATWNAAATAVGNLGTMAEQDADDVVITGGDIEDVNMVLSFIDFSQINSTVIGNLTRAAGNFTTINANESSYIGSDSDSTSDTKKLTVESRGFAGMEVIGDTTNSGSEPGGAFYYLSQDGGAVTGLLSLVQSAGGDGRGGSFTGTINNTMLVGNGYSSGALQLGAGGAVRMGIAPNGQIVMGNATTLTDQILSLPNSSSQQATAHAWNTYSDRRLKDNIVRIDSALDKINSLNGYYYNFTEAAVTPHKQESLTQEEADQVAKDAAKRCMGGISQEWDEVVPEICVKDSEGVATAINYSGLVPCLVEALKEITGRVETLEGVKK